MLPLRLRPDNFTPPSRTPWGGRRIVEHLKAGLPLGAEVAAYPVVGESWELSAGPDFPSRLTDGRLLADVLAESPVAMLGRHAAERSTSMLVKLLDAADNLSVQVHPDDSFAGLRAGEGGKPEAWIVVDRQEGAGIYLGLAEGVGRGELEAAARSEADLRPMLNFARVEPGDAFVIAPGTVHAIGAGVTLIEPQVVTAGATGTTYRFWDWNRRYAADGRLDPRGRPRPLHLDRSLAVTNFDGPRGAACVAAARARPVIVDGHPGAHRERLCQLAGVWVERVTGSGAITVPPLGTMAALIVVDGTIAVASDEGPATAARRGETLVVPAVMASFNLSLKDATVIMTWCGV